MHDVLTVTELTRQIKDCLEGNFPAVAVRGELSGITRAASGHVYLNLKDDGSQIRCVMWKGKASRLKFDLTDGLEVVAVGAIDVYVPRGGYNLVLDEIVPQGLGPLELAFRQLHDRLAAEGLFSDDRKKPLPEIPGRIALITSPTGAAIRDMLQVLTRRWPAADVVVVPVPVQGEEAAPKIAAGLQAADRLNADVIICGRGGGSVEDLWAFNEEIVARAIAASHTPVISAVGHEIDVTIADLVADRRALTPTEGAEVAVPDRAEVLAGLRSAAARMETLLRSKLDRAREVLDSMGGRRIFTRPADLLIPHAARVDELHQRAAGAMQRRLSDSRARVSSLAGQFDALSPLGVLARGYSLTQDRNGRLIRDAATLNEGDEIQTRFADGVATSTVTETRTQTESAPP